MLISFEGIDGSGKSTQIEYLKQYFEQKGRKYKVLREPGGTEFGEKVRSLLLDKENDMGAMSEMLLFYAARAQLIEKEVLPALKDDVVVILDRFFDSTFAYQGYGRRAIEIDRITLLNDLVTQGLKPDVTFYLELSVEDAFNRRSGTEFDRMEASGQEFFDRVVEGYKLLARQEDRFVVIDATRSKEDIRDQIQQVVEKK